MCCARCACCAVPCGAVWCCGLLSFPFLHQLLIARPRPLTNSYSPQECLKACPHKSIEFRLRLPGVELWTSHKPLAAEICLMFMLLGSGERRCMRGAVPGEV